MQGDEIRAQRRLEREQGPSSHVFMTERGGPMTPKAFHALFGRIGGRAKMPFAVHPHMPLDSTHVWQWQRALPQLGPCFQGWDQNLRLGPALAAMLNIQHTVRYTELAPDRFKNFWR